MVKVKLLLKLRAQKEAARADSSAGSDGEKLDLVQVNSRGATGEMSLVCA